MIRILRAKNLEFTGIKLINSAKSHLHIIHATNVHIHDMEIEVDVMGQFELSNLFSGR